VNSFTRVKGKNYKKRPIMHMIDPFSSIRQNDSRIFLKKLFHPE
jgi:hypothetical protein